jgi:hypothetical protein
MGRLVTATNILLGASMCDILQRLSTVREYSQGFVDGHCSGIVFFTGRLMFATACQPRWPKITSNAMV